MNPQIQASKISRLISGLTPTLDKDLVSYHRGDTMPVKVSDALSRRGWRGGEFAKWVDDPLGEPTIDIADGRYCSFFPYGSKEQYDENSATEQSQVSYGYTTIVFGGNYVYTRVYEQYGYLARHSLGPVIPLVYTPNQNLYVSENGKITNEDESDFGIFPVHTFPNGDPITSRFVFFGICSVIPKINLGNFMAVQTNFGI